MKRMIISILLVVFAVVGAYACFDTYLFLNKYSMVYPKGKFVADTLVEYSANKITSPEEDTFFMNVNIFYGIIDRLSIQLGVESSEITRNDVFAIEGFGVRGVYNVVSESLLGLDNFTFDIILEHHEGFWGKNMSLEFSFPGIFYAGKVVGVIHPVFSLANLEQESFEYSLGGHCGVFYLISDSALVGIGAEYQSAQNGSAFGSRIIEGEAGVSLFFGAKLGDSVYLQNEFAKGLANSRDFGMAVTIKFIP